MSGMFGDEGFVGPGSVVVVSENVGFDGLEVFGPFLGCLGMNGFWVWDRWI